MSKKSNKKKSKKNSKSKKNVKGASVKGHLSIAKKNKKHIEKLIQRVDILEQGQLNSATDNE